MSTQYEIVNIGTLPNDGEGDPLRVAFAKINNNFANLFATTSVTANTITVGSTGNQVLFEYPVSSFTQGLFQIRSMDAGTPNSQDIMLQAQINNDNNQVKFTGYGTSFFGTPICSYDMDLLSGNVRILCNPLGDYILTHFVSAQVTYMGPGIPGVDIALDGYSPGNLMSTESNLVMTTESV